VKFLLDTNVLSEALKPSPDAGVVERLEALRDMVATAAPVWHELQFGYRRLQKSKKRIVVKKYLQEVVRPNIPILAYDAAAAEWHSQQRAYLTAIGQTPSFVDGQIAAIAYTNDLILVTRNRTDFARFQDLAVENWHSQHPD
jgi:tRNA(fMet)-specific endonuclease VapC